mgnify:CR=1 FL=1|jgi:hypothetical protein
MKSYYSKLQQRFIAREEYFDELLFGTLNDENYDKPIQTKYDSKSIIQ